jgi:hypothetical protein
MKMLFGFRQIILLVFGCAALLAGCGSGGSGSNGVVSLNPSAIAKATVQMSATTIQTNGNANVTAVYTNSSGQAISGLQVKFSTTLGSFNPASGSATTDSTGTATIQLLAGNTTGSGTVTALATVSGSKVSSQVSFSVVPLQAVIASVKVGLANLAPLGSTGITVTLTDSSGNPFTTPVSVSFGTVFAAAGKANIISPVTSVDGVASSTYTALAGAVGTDTITVTVGTATATANVAIAAPAASSIQFVPGTQTNISLKGMGGVGGDEALLVFKVLDANGDPKSGVTVNFALNTTVGGLALSSYSGSTASDGTVSTTVESGTIATPVRVTASIPGTSPLISTQSTQLVVSTGIPAQDGFSISISNHNSQSYDHDGVTVQVTARLSDHFHNPVPDGTAVYFTTNGGSIMPSCTTAGGVCSVTWTSQNPRPDGTFLDGSSNPALVARPTIFAYAIGEESFIDENGNGVADSGPCTPIPASLGSGPGVPGIGQAEQCGEYISIPEAFRDDSWLGFRQSYDPFIDFFGTGVYEGPDALYHGVLRPSTVPASVSQSLDIFFNSQIVMSTDAAQISFDDCNYTSPTFGGPSNPKIPQTKGTPGASLTTEIAPLQTFCVTIQDANGNTMASGTTVTVKVPFGTTSGLVNYTYPDSIGYFVSLPISVAPTSSCKAQSGFVQVDVQSVGTGLVTTNFFPISGCF